MALTRDEKTQIIDELANDLTTMRGVVFTEYRGTMMKDLSALREKLREEGIVYHVVKTSLLKIALNKAKITVPDEILDIPLAMALGKDDEVTPAKIVVTTSKELDSMKVVGGLIDQKFVDGTMVKKLAQLPAREELYGKVVGSVASPLTSMIGVLQGNIRGLISVLKQYQTQIS